MGGVNGKQGSPLRAPPLLPPPPPSRASSRFLSFALKNKAAPATQVRSRVLHGNKVAFNKVLGITKDFFGLSNSKIYEKEPRYNETSL